MGPVDHFRRLLGLDWLDALRAWMDRPATHRIEGWGRTLAAVGCAAFGLGVAFEIAAMHLPMGVVLLGLVLARAPVHRMPGFWPLVVLLGWAAVSAAVQGRADFLDGLGYLYAPLALPLLCCAVVARPWALRWTTIAALTGLLLHTALAATQFVVGLDSHAPLQVDPDGNRFRYAPGWRERNVGPAMYAGALLLVAWHSRPGERAPAALQWAARIAGIGAVVMTKARTALAALCAAVVGGFATSWRRALAAALAALLLGGTGLGLLALRDPERVEKTLRFEDPRWRYWSFGWHDVCSEPLFGQGGRRAFREGVEARWQAVHPDHGFHEVVKYNLHNTPLNYAAFHGVPAGLLHLLFLLALGVVCWRAARSGGLAFAAWCYVVVCGTFDATWSNQTTAYPFALLLALCLVPGADGSGDRMGPDDNRAGVTV